MEALYIPKLQGTEKQIKYAEDILRQHRDRLEAKIQEGEEKSYRKSRNGVVESRLWKEWVGQYKAMRVAYNKFLEALDYSHAGDVINEKSENGFDLLDDYAGDIAREKKETKEKILTDPATRAEVVERAVTEFRKFFKKEKRKWSK